MKKIRKILSISLMVVLASSLLSVSAFAAEPTVVFNVTKGEFVFKDGDGLLGIFRHTDKDAHEHPQNPDLFPDIKNAFPGDTLEQEIRLRIENASDERVTIYLTAELPNDDYLKLFESAFAAEDGESGDAEVAALLARAREELPTLTVEYGEEEYDAAYLGRPIDLGTFTRFDDSAQLDVVLDIPIGAGNELQGLVAEVNWVFTAELRSGGGGGGDDIEAAEIPGEDLPLADLPDEEPPLTDLQDEEPPLAMLPQTGLLQWPILVMSLLGLMLITFGVLSERKRKAGKK